MGGYVGPGGQWIERADTPAGGLYGQMAALVSEAWIWGTSLGIVPDGVALYDATTTNSTTSTINSATASFTQADVGKVCAVVPYTDTQLISGTSGSAGTITAVNSPTQCVVSLNLAPGALSGATFVYGTDNKAALDSALTSASTPATKGHVWLPPGIICSTGQHTVPSGVLLHGCGNNPTGGPAKNFKHYGTSLVACKYFSSGAFFSTGSFGSNDPRGAAIEHLNIDTMAMQPKACDGSASGRTERLFAVTFVRSSVSSPTLVVGPTGRAMLCHILHNVTSDAVQVSGDGKILDCVVVGSASGRARIAVSNPTDVLVARNHVWQSNGSTVDGYGIRVSGNSGNLIAGACTIVDNEIDTTYNHAYYVSCTGGSKLRAINISGGHVFQNDTVTTNAQSVLGVNIDATSSILGLIFRNVAGMASWEGINATGQWEYLVKATIAGGGVMAGFSTGGCVVQGCNNMYSGITPDVDDVNIILAGTSSVVTKSTRI